MRKRRIKITLLVLLTPVVLLFVFLLEERVRGKISLARYKRELIDLCGWGGRERRWR